MSTEKNDKRHSKGQATRGHLIQVAARLFTEQGYEATSIEEILQNCDISRGALYHHFANKEHLFEAVFETIEQDITAKTAQATLREADPVERLRIGCRSFLSSAQNDSFRQVALIDAPLVLGWKKWREIESRYGLGILKAGLAAALDARGKTLDTMEQTAHLLLAALIEAVLLIAAAEDRKSAAHLCSAAVDSLLDGILR